jgi:hypothetical protein
MKLPGKVINLVHMLVVAPLLVYLWYRGAYEGEEIPKDLLNVVGLLGVLVFVYHGFKLSKHLKLM